MLIYIFGGIAVFVAILMIVIAMQPGKFRITRSLTIPAPATALFEQVNDFHKWQAWSPWARMDPTAKNTFAGASSGEGAIFSWVGNNQVGEGKMTLIESRPCESIRIKLDFLKPFQASHTSEFTFAPLGETTLVTWSMWGQNNFMAKAVVLVMNCDKMIGGQFEKGLINLREVTTSETAAGLKAG
jgi:hypothetical protein